MDRPRVAIVIPALNEQIKIASVVRSCLQFGTVIVVDDGSDDDTAAVAAAAGAKVVRHATNKGYDQALNSGFAEADKVGCEFILTLDADGQHDPDIAQQFVDALSAGADIAVGIRTRFQRISEALFSFVTQSLYGLTDPLCGFKGYRISLYRALGHFDSYRSIGTELTLFAVRNGFRLRQIPVPIRRRDGAPRFGDGIRPNFTILRALIIGILSKSISGKSAT